MKNVLKTLKERGLIDQMTSEELCQSEAPLSVYIGFDPTSDSLHLGSMVGLMVLAWFQKLGGNPIAVVGGATGMIGDPSGKSVERNLLTPEIIEKNLIGIKKSIATVVDFEKGGKILNNYDWFKQFTFIDFLRDVGKHFRISVMMAKDSVKSRMETEEGMSFTEFSYQLLQAYDFLYLFDHHKVTLQMGGSDQWGNITAGTDLIRKVRGAKAHGATFPLLTRSDGKKFGKTEEGAIWLNSDKLSVYDFYQYLYRTSDQDVIKLMRMITFMDMEEIRQIESEMASKPNFAQKKLAQAVTEIVHGKEGVKMAEEITSGAAPGAKTELNETTLEKLSQELPTYKSSFDKIMDQKLSDLLPALNVMPSKAEVRRLIGNGGLYLNNEKVQEENYAIKKEDLIAGKYLLIALGKKKKILIFIT